MTPTLEQLQRCTESTANDAAKYHPWLCKAMERFSINTPVRVAAFLATVAVESGYLKRVEEDLFYRSADRIHAIFPTTFPTAAVAMPYVMNPKLLGQRLYSGYWGRGLIQLTWQSNYSLASIGIGCDYVTNPHLLTEPEHAAMSAAWYWHNTACNVAADRDDIKGVTRLVNGKALMHLDERTRLFLKAKKVLA